ncbi:MAG: hypothetical protein IPN58_20160 [Anaerolineales bacterium]|nr:hypothetical protein [Anaerolineales bacterium]
MPSPLDNQCHTKAARDRQGDDPTRLADDKLFADDVAQIVFGLRADRPHIAKLYACAR